MSLLSYILPDVCSKCLTSVPDSSWIKPYNIINNVQNIKMGKHTMFSENWASIIRMYILVGNLKGHPSILEPALPLTMIVFPKEFSFNVWKHSANFNHTFCRSKCTTYPHVWCPTVDEGQPCPKALNISKATNPRPCLPS